MKKITSGAVLLATQCGLALGLPQFATAAEGSSSATSTTNVEEIIIKAMRSDRQSGGATGLSLDVYETPQSLTILDAETLDNFGLVDINQMLEMSTGVNVDATETDRTTYNARGFDITSMHVDGIGIPFGELIVGDLDTAIYEKVEIIRGSNGLITGLGNPSGTVNYVRKRPGNEQAMSTSLTVGRWNDRRVVADVSTPLTESGRWALRVVGAYQDNESWLDLYANNRVVGSFVVDGQIGNSVTLALGYTHQDNESDGATWGAVPFIYNNGVQADFDVSTTTAMEWTYWNTQTDTAFVELGWQATDAIRVTSTLTQTDYEEQSEMFYAYWNTGLDPATGLGLHGYPGKYDGGADTRLWTTVVESRFDAWGREHQLNVGMSLADHDSVTDDFLALSGFDVMPAFPGWTGAEVARPAWGPSSRAAADDMSLNRLYASLLLSVTDQVNLILGASKVDYENEGSSWGVSTDSDEDGGSPYIGVTWEVADDLNLYASYSDIYQPQYYLDENQQPLGSAEGSSLEAGLKKQFGGNLLATVAVFRTEQENLQEFVSYTDGDGIDDTDYSDDFNFSEYRGINVEAEGIELEVSGYVTDTVRLQAGFTHLKMEDPNGDEQRTYIPRNSLKLLASWAPEWQPRLDLGLSARWQDDVYVETGYGRITQESYGVLGGYVNYALSDKMSVSLNLDNMLDEKYLSSVHYDQSFYAMPLNYSLSLRWSY